MRNNFLRNLQIGFGISLLILLISSVASYLSILNLKKSADWVNHTNIVLQQSERVISDLKDAETGQRGYLLTGNEDFLKPYEKAKVVIQSNIDSLKYLTRDNDTQQQNCIALKALVEKRIEILQQLINLQKTGKIIDASQLYNGQKAMDDTRQIILRIQAEEHRLLVIRTKTLDSSAIITPFVIIIASLLAIGITFFFYRRLKSDYDIRLQLQQDLEQKDKDINTRIDIIKNIALQITAGDYEARVADTDKDSLGQVSGSLNNMAQSLQTSFYELKNRDWLKTGAASLNERMVGEKNDAVLTQNIIDFIAEYTNSQAGVFYLSDNKKLYFKSGFACQQHQQDIQFNEGLIGQCAASGKEIVLNNLPQDKILITYATGAIAPDNVLLFPVFHETELKGVIELASLSPYSELAVQFVLNVSQNIGLAIEGAQRRVRMQQLLEETQAQAEELQQQQSELENINSELEAQSQKLQVSEEELRVQQEELMQANQELQERSVILEEKNQTIVERNIEIQKKAEELETTTRYKSEFLANMSHELRTPLNSILLLSRLLSENNNHNLNDDQIEYARVIQSSGNGLLSLIDEILDLSKIEAGKMKLEFNDVSLKGIAENMRVLFAAMAKEKNLKFEINIDDTAPATIHTDAMRLEQILKNLLSNSLKFTSRGAVTLNIKKKSNAVVQFSVLDTGIGIASEKQQLIFEAFQQADGSTRRRYGGTGLGLSISRELAKLLGGEVKLKSEAGKGSEFTIEVPVYLSAANLPELLQNRTVNQEKKEGGINGQPIADADRSFVVTAIPEDVPDDRDKIQTGDKVILIVEDDTNFAQTLLSFTQKNGYKGLIAVRGDYGIELAKQYVPTAILLDIKLPVKDGWQVMEELKNNNVTRHIPVHIMSSLPYEEESIEKGAIDFLSKPVAFEKLPNLFKTIEDALARGPKKVLIVEENSKHAQALSYFLETYNVNAKFTGSIEETIGMFQQHSADCVVLDLGVFNSKVYEALEKIKEQEGLENLPIVIFTGKTLSKSEEQRIKQISGSIVVKTANSYKRILDEIGLFLHIVEENNLQSKTTNNRKLNALEQVLENKTVLIADDDVRNIFSLTKALEAHKMTVVSATDGKEALSLLKINPQINIVLMDMMMPEMDGYEAIQEIRKIPQYRNLPVLAITAKAMYGDREKCIEAGASDYISKPVDIDQLTSLLRVWLYDKL